MKDFVFKKKFGQNFISDKNLLNAIVSDANIYADDEVLEIGPGAGSLTQVLSEKAKKSCGIRNRQRFARTSLGDESKKC